MDVLRSLHRSMYDLVNRDLFDRRVLLILRVVALVMYVVDGAVHSVVWMTLDILNVFIDCSLMSLVPRERIGCTHSNIHTLGVYRPLSDTVCLVVSASSVPNRYKLSFFFV